MTWWGVNLKDTCVFAGDVRGLEFSPGFEASVPASLGFIQDHGKENANYYLGFGGPSRCLQRRGQVYFNFRNADTDNLYTRVGPTKSASSARIKGSWVVPPRSYP